MVAVLALGTAAEARAAYVNRGLTLPESEWALDLGLGVAHDSPPDITGLGFNLELPF